MTPTWRLRPPSGDLAAWYRSSGWWTDQTLGELVDAGLRQASDRVALVRSRVRPFWGTVGDVGDMGCRLAAALARRGIAAGDVVAFQLPNWAEAAACVYGLLRMGAVLVPIVHTYGPREVAHILRQSGARALVTADRFGRHDYLADLEPSLGSLPDLELVVVVPTKTARVPPLGHLEVLAWQGVMAGAPSVAGVPSSDPDRPAVIAYTSGTTADPKGVIHTHRTFLADQRTWRTFLGHDRSGPPASRLRGSVTAAPIGHITGLSGALRPLLGSEALDLMDAWDPKQALTAMATEGVTVGGGAPYFLLTLLDHPDFDPLIHLPFMDRQTMGGAPVPRDVVERATALGISITRAYGSTEHPSTTASLHSDPFEKRTFTDGRALSGSELRILDPDGRPVAPGEVGEIYSRGPELFAGYTDPILTDLAIDRDGWYETGDRGCLDEDGYLTITDRSKDVIIRGGENVSATEVEGLIGGLDGVAEVAVVAAPDRRYGEHGAAVVRLIPGARAPELGGLRSHLLASGLARQKWPEELRIVDDFPRTASGKIQKHVLREALRASGGSQLPFERSVGSTPRAAPGEVS